MWLARLSGDDIEPSWREPAIYISDLMVNNGKELEPDPRI
jgi:hypothetical protein